jgi:hypothetical protein
MSSFGRVALDSPKIYSDLVQRCRNAAPPDLDIEGECNLGNVYEARLLEKGMTCLCLLTYVSRGDGLGTTGSRHRDVYAVVLVPMESDKCVCTRIGLLFSDSWKDKVSFAAWNMEDPQKRQTIQIV